MFVSPINILKFLSTQFSCVALTYVALFQDYSISSMHIRNSSCAKKSQHTLIRPDNGEKVKKEARVPINLHVQPYVKYDVILFSFQDSPFVKASQTPVSKLLKKVENAGAGSVLSIPKHRKKASTYFVWFKNLRKKKW